MDTAVKPTRRTVTRPNSFVFTLYGDLVHRLAGEGGEGSLWIGSLIALMAPFGISPAAVRQAVSRMSRQGWLVGHREGNRAFYAVTDRGRRRIGELSPRIYGPVIDWDGRWRMLTYTVSETERDRRDRLRSELTVLGWAPLSASTWISPSDSLDAARQAAAACGASESVHLFSAEYAGPLTDRQLLERCWDVEAIAAAYRDFIDRYQGALERHRRHLEPVEGYPQSFAEKAPLDVARGEDEDEEAFVQRLWLVHDYRKFAYVDPGLPSELVPAHWPGTTAAALFREYYAALDSKSLRYFRRIVGNGA